MTKIITLYSGPGAGKSTTSAFMYAWLKARGASVELCREVVKKWAWQKRAISGWHEYTFVGRQIDEESMLFEKVEFVITDKPLLLDILYARRYASPTIAKGIEAAVLSYYQAAQEAGHEHVHVLLRRSKPYDPRGRYEDEATARKMDEEVRALLSELGWPIVEIGTDMGDVLSFAEKLCNPDVYWGFRDLLDPIVEYVALEPRADKSIPKG